MDLHSLTITETKKNLKERKFSVAELTKVYLARIKKLEPVLHSFVTVAEERAMKDAELAASSRVLNNFIPPYNATVVEKLVSSGIVLLGKTNMDAWAHGSSTETSDYGATRNPWDTGKLPGGSSGGAAASVAADECLVAIGSETAGSIRQPSAWCGTVGLKPTYGRVSRYGVVAMGSSLDSPGPITKTVEDAALILNILAGIDPYDATTSSLEVKDYLKFLKTPRKMTIGIPDDYFTGVNSEIIDAVNEATKTLQKLGHKVKKITLFDPKYAIDVYTILQRSEVSSNLARYDGIRFGDDRSKFGEEAKRRIMLGTYALSAGYYNAYYKKAQKVRTIIIQDFARAFEGVDVIIGPSTPVTALKLGASKNNPMFGELMDVLIEPSSIAGLCAINMPVGLSSESMPIGMQIIGPQYGEETILNIAYQYELENPFYLNKPRI